MGGAEAWVPPREPAPRAWEEQPEGMKGGKKRLRHEGSAGGVAGSRKGSEQQCPVVAALPDVAGIAPNGV